MCSFQKVFTFTSSSLNMYQIDNWSQKKNQTSLEMWDWCHWITLKCLSLVTKDSATRIFTREECKEMTFFPLIYKLCTYSFVGMVVVPLIRNQKILSNKVIIRQHWGSSLCSSDPGRSFVFWRWSPGHLTKDSWFCIEFYPFLGQYYCYSIPKLLTSKTIMPLSFIFHVLHGSNLCTFSDSCYLHTCALTISSVKLGQHHSCCAPHQALNYKWKPRLRFTPHLI